VNEPALVEAINRLRGEWAERSGGELAASGTTWKELSSAKAVDADLIIFPSRYLGDLCVRGQLRPVRSSVLESENLKSADIFPLVRNELIRWGGQTMALPLGIDSKALGHTPGQPNSLSLLTLAAPHAISNERLGVLFDSETMKPRIEEPAFVDALTQLASGNAEPKATPTNNEQPQIPVLGYGDRLAAVTASSHNAASAFKLLEWIAQGSMSSQFARIGSGQLSARRSVASAPDWYESSLSASDRAERAKSMDAALSGQQAFVIPRIPGIDEYLAALDEAVKAATADHVAPAAALQKTAATWEQITNAHGRDKQLQAFQKHLGISNE
jgi:maltose-binding protein MalE